MRGSIFDAKIKKRFCIFVRDFCWDDLYQKSKNPSRCLDPFIVCVWSPTQRSNGRGTVLYGVLSGIPGGEGLGLICTVTCESCEVYWQGLFSSELYSQLHLLEYSIRTSTQSSITTLITHGGPGQNSSVRSLDLVLRPPHPHVYLEHATHVASSTILAQKLFPAVYNMWTRVVAIWGFL